jgi:outer membrane lipoprotein SlyB
MSRKEIEANSIADEGDFIAVKTKGTRGASAVGGAIVGTLLDPTGGTILGALLGGVLGKDESTKLIPKSDIVEITKDASGKVTVVVDEDRVSRR